MPSLLETIEGYLRDNHVQYLNVLLKQYGVTLKVYEKTINKETKVYGKEASSEENFVDEIEGLVVSADLVPTDGVSSGTFDEGFLFTNSKLSLVGREVAIKRDDDLNRRYRVESELSQGMTTRVFTRYRLAPIGD